MLCRVVYFMCVSACLCVSFFVSVRTCVSVRWCVLSVSCLLVCRHDYFRRTLTRTPPAGTVADLPILPVQPQLVRVYGWRCRARGAVDREASRKGYHRARAGGDAVRGETSAVAVYKYQHTPNRPDPISTISGCRYFEADLYRVCS